MSAAILRRRPVKAWPEIDCRMWQAGLSRHYAATLSPGTIQLAGEGYGRWIIFLRSQGWLDDHIGPDNRAEPDTVLAYIETLRDRGNQRLTIAVRLGQLATALRIMAPEVSHLWLHPSRLLGNRPPPRSAHAGDYQLQGWPIVDRQFWDAGTQAGDILSGAGYAARLSPKTINSIIAGYRRWLAFLRSQGLLHATTSPALRVTRENVVIYIQELRERHCNASLIARLSELRSAMRIMEPDHDFRWLTSPGGCALSSLFPITQSLIQVFSSKFLYRWGHAIMQGALNDPHPDKRRIAYRNGLVIALFAARAPRVRSMASLRLRETVILSGKRYKLVFEKEDVKTSRSIEYHAPVGLSAAITHYIEVERAELLAGQNHDWLWVNKYGERLSADNISDMIQRRSRRAFGEAFGPHRFRHALGTTAPLADPAHPGVAAAILGVSGQMVEEHYNRASQADVAHRFHASLLKDRAKLASLARREFWRFRGLARRHALC